jgi:2-oxoglutarate ferredoxin oxidoreductase subunit gamma
MRKEILLAGFGGQGIVVAGYIIGKAAAIYDKKNAVFTQSYGPEARGGACSAGVIIADEPIGYPYLTKPTLAIIMSQEAWRKYSTKVLAGKSPVVILDKDLVNIGEQKIVKGKIYRISATRIAEELGKRIVANIVMLGFFTRIANLISTEAMKESIITTVPKTTIELNLKAFERGYKLCEDFLK